MSLLSSYATVIPCRPEGFFLFVCFCCMMYENCWLHRLVETVRQFRMFVSSLKLKKKMAALSGLSFSQERNALAGKRKCPIQKSNLGWTSLGWSVCCSLGSTQTDLVGYTSGHCIPLGKRSCSRTAFQINFLPETKGLINKKLNTVLGYLIASHVKWSGLVLLK